MNVHASWTLSMFPALIPSVFTPSVSVQSWDTAQHSGQRCRAGYLYFYWWWCMFSFTAPLWIDGVGLQRAGDNTAILQRGCDWHFVAQPLVQISGLNWGKVVVAGEPNRRRQVKCLADCVEWGEACWVLDLWRRKMISSLHLFYRCAL